MQQSVVYFALCCVEDLEENLMSLNVAESTVDVDDDRCGFRLIRNGKQRTQKNLTCTVRL